MKKHEINFLQTTTIEHLQDQIPSCYGAAVTFGEKMLVTMVNWRGKYEAAIYEFIETPEKTGLGAIECRLNLTEIADGTFTDGGHAMQQTRFRHRDNRLCHAPGIVTYFSPLFLCRVRLAILWEQSDE